MDKKRQRGRPELPDDEKRKPAFVMRLTDDEFALVKQAAKGNVLGWARDALLRAAKRARGR